MPAVDGAGKTAAGRHPLDGQVPVGPGDKIKPSPALIAKGQLIPDLRIRDHKALVGNISDLLPVLLKRQFLIGKLCCERIPHFSKFDQCAFEPDILLQERLVG